MTLYIQIKIRKNLQMMSLKRPASPMSPRPSTPPSSPPPLKRKKPSSTHHQYTLISKRLFDTCATCTICTTCKGIINPRTTIRLMHISTKKDTIPEQKQELEQKQEQKLEQKLEQKQKQDADVASVASEPVKRSSIICWCHLGNSSLPIPFRISKESLQITPSEISKINLHDDESEDVDIL